MDIYYAPKKDLFTDSLKLIFNGGVLTDEQISQIKLQNAELEEYTFISPEKAIPTLSPSLQRSVPNCLRAIATATNMNRWEAVHYFLYQNIMRLKFAEWKRVLLL